MRNYIILNGNNSNEITGLLIQELPPITKPKIRTQIEEINGRDGDIVTNLGYSAYNKEISIGLYGNYNVDDVIAYFNNNKTGEVIFSNEPDKYYNYEIFEQIDFNRLIRFKTASVKMHVQPFKYPTEEEAIEIEAEAVTGTGEAITLNDVAEDRILLNLKGNTSQETTTGQQLYDVFDPLEMGDIVSIDNDGWITVSYDNSSGASTKWFDCKTKTSNLVQTNTTYKLVVEIKSVSGTGAVNFMAVQPICQFEGDNVSVQLNSTTTGVKTYNITTKDDFTGCTSLLNSYGKFNAGESGSITFRMSVLADLSVTPQTFIYEPYTNGASPNPDYPQPIEIVTGENIIKIYGKNIYNPNYRNNNNFNSARCNVSEADGVFTFQATGTDMYLWYTKVLNSDYSADAGQLYEFKEDSYTCTLTNPLFSTNYVTYYDENKKSLSYVLKTSNSFTINKTDKVGAKYFSIRIGVVNSVSGTTYTTSIMLESGGTASTYVPYQEQNYNINLGKNLFDVSAFESQLVTGKILNDSGVETNNSGSTYSTYKIYLKANTTYYFKGAWQRIYHYTQSNVWIGRDASHSGYDISYTPTQNEYIQFQINNAYWASNKGEEQLEVGSQATTYAPYFTPIELCKIGTYQDYLYKSGDNWYKHKEIGKITLDGTEDITQNSNTSYSNTILRFTISVSDKKLSASNTEVDDIKCNMFTPRTLNFDARTQQSIAGHDSNHTIIIFIDSSELSSADTTGFKAWLSSNTPVVYYILETPVEEQITDEALITQLDDIYDTIHSYDTQTNITQTNDNKPFIMEAKAVLSGSNEGIVENVGNFYSKPVIEIEGIGSVEAYLNNIHVFTIDLSETNTITIDTANLEAYNPDTKALMNRKVTGSYENFKLAVGENTLKFTGSFVKAKITKYVRWL